MSVPPPSTTNTPAPSAPRLLDQLRQAALAHFGRPEPAERIVECSRRYILFHHKRHPKDMGAAEVGRFLEHVVQTAPHAVDAVQNAHEALVFLYHHIIGRDLPELTLPPPPRLL